MKISTNEKSKLIKIKKKIGKWKKEGYNVDDLDRKVLSYELDGLNQKKEAGESEKISNNKKFLAVIITIFIIAILVIYWNSGMMVPNTNETNEKAPIITFTKDESLNTLAVVQIDGGIAWDDIKMSATDGTNTYYNTGYTTIVTAGDTIDFDDIGLDGDVTITFSYMPTNALIGTYKLNDVRSGEYVATPTMTFTKDESMNALIVVQSDIGVEWSDIKTTATDGTNTIYFSPSGSVDAGDAMVFDGRGLSGDITITIKYILTDKLIAIFELNEVSPT